VYTITFSRESYIPHAIKQTVSAEGELPSVITVLMSILDPEQLHPSSTRIAVCWDVYSDYDLSIVFISPGGDDDDDIHVQVNSWHTGVSYPILVSGDWEHEPDNLGGCELARVNYTSMDTVVFIDRFNGDITNHRLRVQAYTSLDQIGPVKVLSTAPSDTEWPVFCISESDVRDPADTACSALISVVNEAEHVSYGDLY
jgi:hypothetical protein